MDAEERAGLHEWFLPQLAEAWDERSSAVGHVDDDRYVQWAGYSLGLQIECVSNRHLSGDARRVMYRAAAALPYDDIERATTGLRGQLRLMAAASGATPDWTTLAVEGPTEAVGLHGRMWFEWTATVVADGGAVLSDDWLDAAIWGAGRQADSVAVEDTAPHVRAL